MTTRIYYQWLASGLLLGSILVLWVLMGIPQPEADALTYLALGVGLLLSLSSFLTFLGLELRGARRTSGSVGSQFGSALRQAVELSLLVILGAGLWAIGSLGPWEGGLLAAAVVFAELALSSQRSPLVAKKA